MELDITAEQIARHYSAAMDSVNLINQLKAKPELDAEEQARMQSNQTHLTIMLAKDFWTNEDLAPLQDAIL